MRRTMLVVVTMALLGSSIGAQTDATGTTEMYFVDTEGGQAVLDISPAQGILGAKETLLIDAGNLNPPGRDADRIQAAMKDAGVERIDYLVVSHYHGDHSGGVGCARRPRADPAHPDPGPYTPEMNGARAAGFLSYLTVRQKAIVSIARPGQKIPVAGLDVHVVSSAGELITIRCPVSGAPQIPSAPTPSGDAGQYAQQLRERGPRPGVRPVQVSGSRGSDLEPGDGTGLSVEPAGHGFGLPHDASRHRVVGRQALVHTVRPRVAVMNNNPTKGGVPITFKVLKSSPGLEDPLAAPLVR